MEAGGRWKQIEAVFEQACELAGADRDSYVARACDGDEALRCEVESLLANATGARPVLQRVLSAAADTFASEAIRVQVGSQLGPYRLVALIGEGGMGVVYLAERDDSHYRRRVAIKVLRPGAASPHLISRFRDERQILAALEHPGIVRLLDGGNTGDGLPYLVMDYIEGVSLTRHVNERNLSVRERVALVVRICAAVQYAHQHLVGRCPRRC